MSLDVIELAQLASQLLLSRGEPVRGAASAPLKISRIHPSSPWQRLGGLHVTLRSIFEPYSLVCYRLGNSYQHNAGTCDVGNIMVLWSQAVNVQWQLCMYVECENLNEF
jgi:hypothetical protein